MKKVLLLAAFAVSLVFGFTSCSPSNINSLSEAEAYLDKKASEVFDGTGTLVNKSELFTAKEIDIKTEEELDKFIDVYMSKMNVEFNLKMQAAEELELPIITDSWGNFKREFYTDSYDTICNKYEELKKNYIKDLKDNCSLTDGCYGHVYDISRHYQYDERDRYAKIEIISLNGAPIFDYFCFN